MLSNLSHNITTTTAHTTANFHTNFHTTTTVTTTSTTTSKESKNIFNILLTKEWYGWGLIIAGSLLVLICLFICCIILIKKQSKNGQGDGDEIDGYVSKHYKENRRKMSESHSHYNTKIDTCVLQAIPQPQTTTESNAPNYSVTIDRTFSIYDKEKNKKTNWCPRRFLLLIIVEFHVFFFVFGKY